MSYVFRVLNDFDVSMNPKKNGIICKKEILEYLEEEWQNFLYYYTWTHKDLILSNEDLKIPNKEICPSLYNLDSTRISTIDYSASIRLKDIIDFIKKEFANLSPIDYEKHPEFRGEEFNIIQQFIYNIIENKNKYNVSKFFETLRSSTYHIRKGSTSNTNWISTSTKFDCLKRYYMSQDKHSIAIIQCPNFFPIGSINFERDAFAIYAGIEYSAQFLKLLLCYSPNIPTYNYSISDNELLFYKKINPQFIKYVFNAFQIELYNNGFIDDAYLENDNCTTLMKIYLIQKLLSSKDLSDMDKIIIHEHFINSKSLKSLATDGNFCELVDAKKRLLSKIDVPNYNIKHVPLEKIRVMEE